MQIICFATADWESYHRKEMIKTLARVGGENVDILCINRPIDFLVTPIKHISKFIKWIFGKNRFEQIYDNMNVYTPLLLIHDLIASRLPLLNSLLISSLRRQILKRISLHDSKEIICWISSPNQVHFLNLFPKSTVVYDVIDEHTLTISGQVIERFERIEQALLNRADIVFTASENLYNTKKKIALNVHYIPTGINRNFIRSNSDPIPFDILELYNKIPSPRIGYLGNVRNWMDFSLLRYLALNKTDYSIVFIGSIDKHAPINKISKLKNVFFLNKIDYDQAIFHLKQMDVCIIPFIINKFSINSCPYKLFDYMAANKPVISTDLPEARKFYPYVLTAKDKTDFTQKLEKAVESRHSFSIPKSIIYENLWENRVARMLKVINDTLNIS